MQNLIKKVQTEFPRGAPFDLEMLAAFGVSPKAAARYADAGWLVRLGRGVYAFPNDHFDVYSAIIFLQKKVPGLHLAGKSALDMHGIRHNLYVRKTHVLWGDGRFVLPEWFTVTEGLQKATNTVAIQLPSSFVTTLFASGFAEATAVWFNAPEA